MLGLLRTGAEHTDGPFCIRYPRDAAPDEPPPMRRDRRGAVRHLGGAAAGARRSRSSRSAPWCCRRSRPPRRSPPRARRAVVNCRFLKPLDERHARGAMLAHRHPRRRGRHGRQRLRRATSPGALQTTIPRCGSSPLGVPDRLIEQAPRAEQLGCFGLTPAGHRAPRRALQHEESLEAAMNVGVVGNPRYDGSRGRPSHGRRRGRASAA